MYRVKDYINIDKEILSGNPVFRGTRVPIQTLFDHLEKGIPLDEFLNDFPTVKKEQAVAVIEIVSKILTSKNIEQIYETAAWWKSSQKLIENKFDALLTFDKNLQYQQNFTKYTIAVIVLNAPDNSYATLKEFLQKINDLLNTDLRPGPTEIK